MKFRMLFVCMSVCMLFTSCFNMEEHNEPTLVDTITIMYKQRPFMHLQDVYKSFYQDRFGPAHIITDSASTRVYLEKELDEYIDSSEVYYEPTGAGRGNYMRVYLCAVQDSLITSDELFSAFYRSANTKSDVNDSMLWIDEWKQLVSAVEMSGVKMHDFVQEKKELTNMIEQHGDVAVSHSDAYRKAYHPHYRIVRRDIFDKELLLKIEKGKK